MVEPRVDQQRRSILVVDGDVQIQRLLDLSLRNAGFEVKAVATVAEATAWLGKERPDLIVAEAKLEGGTDGFELCRQVKKRPDAASIAFLFLAERTVETNLRAVEAGADDFVAKPLYVQELVARVRAVLQRRERDRLEARTRQGGQGEEGDEKFIGDLEALPLVDLLRAIQTNKRSGAVQIQAPDGARGEIYFRDGAVVDAEVGRLSGLDAVCRLFSWTAGRFEIEWKSIRRKDAVALESGALLLEALRRLDEWRRVLAEVAPLETIFEVDYHVLAERLAEIPDEVNAILRLFDGQRTFIHVIDDCGLSDLDALAVIGKLHREQIIRDVRARPASVELPGADMEGWIADAAGPFRALSMRPRRELFSPLPEVSSSSGVHRRPTAPPELVEEAPRSPAVGERRERFTDRLIAEGAVPAPEAPAPPPVRPREVLDPAEKTQQGLGLPAPALSTRPGFAAVAVVPQAPPVPRVARDVLTDVTESLGAAAPAAQGIPQPVPPQSAEPAIVVPLVPLVPAPAAAAPAAPPPPVEQKPVAGEILAPPRTTKEDGTAKRVTDLGMGPDRLAAAVSPFAPTSPLAAASGEVVGAPAKVEEIRPAKKIILDPGLPEDNEPPPPSRRLKLVLGGAAGLALAGVLIWFGFSKTERPHGEAAKVEAPPAKVAVVVDARPVAAAVPDAGAAPAPTKRTGPAYEAARKVLDERAGDPKVARALPAEFPVLLAACRTAFTEKRAKDAEIACVAAKDAGPDSAEACALLGHALFGRKKRKEALVWAERAVELDPKQAEAYVIIGGVKQSADDLPAAKAAYKKYLELAPAGQYAADLRAILSTLETP
jgi:CheY-like chemotaxis protein